MIIYATKYRLGTKNCYVIHDMHADFVGATTSKDQFNVLIAAGQTHNLSFIVEDMLDYDRNNQEFVTILTSMASILEQGALLFPTLDTTLIERSSLFHSVQELSAHNLPVINAEFRQAYLLNVWYNARGRTPEAIAIFQQLTAAFNAVIQEIQLYNDTDLLNAYYADVLTCAQRSFAIISDANRILKTAEDRTTFFAAFWDCMIVLLDARLVHYTYLQTMTDRDCVVVAGAEHATAVEHALHIMGYTKVHELGDESIAAYSKDYRNQTHKLQLVPATGLMPILKNMVTSWKLSRLTQNTAKRYKKTLRSAASLPLHTLFE